MPAGGDAVRREPGAHRLGAPLRERLVVGRIAAHVGVALDRDARVRPRVHHREQVVELRLGGGLQVGLVEVEQHVGGEVDLDLLRRDLGLELLQRALQSERLARGRDTTGAGAAQALDRHALEGQEVVSTRSTLVTSSGGAWKVRLIRIGLLQLGMKLPPPMSSLLRRGLAAAFAVLQQRILAFASPGRRGRRPCTSKYGLRRSTFTPGSAASLRRPSRAWSARLADTSVATARAGDALGAARARAACPDPRSRRRPRTGTSAGPRR